MKNYLKTFLNIIFPTQIVEKDVLNNLLHHRFFINKKNDFFSLLPYQNKIVKNGIQDLKFKNNKKNAEIFGELLFENISEYLIDLEIQENFYNPIIITIPLHFLRKISRDYNQNDLVVEYFLKSGGKNFIK